MNRQFIRLSMLVFLNLLYLSLPSRPPYHCAFARPIMIARIQGIKGYPSDNLADFTLADCNNVYVALFLVSMIFESGCASALTRRQASQSFCCVVDAVVHSSSFNSFPPVQPPISRQVLRQRRHCQVRHLPPLLTAVALCIFLRF